VFGGDVEFWLLKGDYKPVDLSIGAGFHVANSAFDFSDSRGVDLTVIASRKATPKLDIYAAIDMAFNSFTNDLFGDLGLDSSFHTLHLVPGIEYKIASNLDFVAELGIALNDEASNYLSGGLAYYVR
jgi:hypothetical protein